MRKIFLLIVLAAGIFSIVTFSNCKKKSTTPDGTAIPAKATISGRVFADFTQDTTNYPGPGLIVYENAGSNSGIKIIATIERKYLIDTMTIFTTAFAMGLGKIQYETFVNSDGSYSLTVDAFNKTVPVKINAIDFTYQKGYIKKWISGSAPTLVSKRTRFYLDEVNCDINRGLVKIQDLIYKDVLLNAK